MIFFSQDVNPSSPIWGRKKDHRGDDSSLPGSWHGRLHSAFGGKGGELCDKNAVIQGRVWEKESETLLFIRKASLLWLFFQTVIVNFQSLYSIRKLMPDDINQQS